MKGKEKGHFSKVSERRKRFTGDFGPAEAVPKLTNHGLLL